MKRSPRPLESLNAGHWFKLICGASSHHLPEIRNLALAYTLAGADCIDVAADPAVVMAAHEGIQVAVQIAQSDLRFSLQGLPLLMVSLNDGEDPHFRKVSFDPERCPVDCSRPCERICPAQAITFDAATDGFSGVISDRCYGCGRCLPICPIQQITATSYIATPASVVPLLESGVVQAIEIHTQVGRTAAFSRLWQALSAHQHHLKVLAVSCPDGEGLLNYLQGILHELQPLTPELIWQTDGRPMSGDIGDGTTRATIRLGEKVLQANLPGHVQLAGGTNDHTVAKLKSLGLLRSQQPPLTPQSRYITGVAYGSFARSLLAPILARVETLIPTYHLEDDPELLQLAVSTAASLIQPLKPMPRSAGVHVTPMALS